ncbi:MAG: FkbM family methyltransferase [bacterium]
MNHIQLSQETPANPGGPENPASQPPIYSHVPGLPPIELVAYYDEFVNYYPRCEMETKQWFVEHIQPDWTILDCGANIGYYTILFAQQAHLGQVHAFEPTRTVEMLKTNLRHHRIANVTVHTEALGNKTGRSLDGIYRIWGAEPERDVYSFTTIDDFVRTQALARVDCIKIDVDSFDFEVLRGARQTLVDFDPYVMVELNHALSRRGQSNAEALEWLAGLGYEEAQVFDHENFLLKRGEKQPAAPSARMITLRFGPASGASTVAGTPAAPSPSGPQTAGPAQNVVPVQELHKKMGWSTPLDYPAASLRKPLIQWKMEVDDSPIFRYLYRHFRPRRHLEFGTWQGTGVLYCLEECEATVWTLNLPRGETLPDGSPAYSVPASEAPDVPAWVRPVPGGYQTDSCGFIGRYYLERNLGKRVCQIYCDSREWDIANYPEGFFDSALIDGGHQEDIVANDTRKAMQLVRSGGLILWHDFCPRPEVLNAYECARGVYRAIQASRPWLQTHMKELFWIYPSWILMGIKK